ncbi:MAG TPA: hypothetical protein VND80_07720 [Steroidobacteraceae bacterium]|nr:hypothetical protein [Steroidobacteraceae bacterium]
MTGDGDDTGEIPILTDAVDEAGAQAPPAAIANTRAAQSAVVAAVLKLADSLLHSAARDIEAILFENVLDRLRAELPEIVERVLREQTPDGVEHPDGDD